MMIVFISLFSLGVYIAASSGHILEPVKIFLAERIFRGRLKIDGEEEYYEFPSSFLSYLWKPVWGCPICMVSLWGAVVYTFFGDWSDPYYFVLCIVCAAAVNFILFFNFIKKHL